MKNPDQNTLNGLTIVKDYITPIPGTNEYEFILMLVDPNITTGENCIMSFEGVVEPTFNVDNYNYYERDTGATHRVQDQKVEISDLRFIQTYDYEGAICKYSISYELYKRLNDFLENEFTKNFNDYFNNEYTSY